MRNLLIVLLSSFLFGCAAWKVAETPQAFAGCAAADAVTTTYAVHAGVAHETNPLLAASVNAHNFVPLILSRIALVGIVWFLYDRFKEYQLARVGTGVATVITCGVAGNNAAIIVRALKM